MPADADADALEAAALADEKVQAFLAGATPKKVIVVAGPAGQPRRLAIGGRYAQPSWRSVAPSFQILVMWRILSPSKSMT